jgi:GH24 family phage-related lysozyme (muramidase)
MDPSKIWTEGWGHAITDANGNFIRGERNKVLAYKFSECKTLEDAERLFDKDLAIRERQVNRYLKVAVEQHQFDMIMSHFYNSGFSETLFRHINARNHTALYDFWVNNYVKSGGVWMLGLALRRTTEANCFRTGKLVYAKTPAGRQKRA